MGTAGTKDFEAVRKKLDLSQEQMARLLGVSFASVNRWEAGHSVPTKSVKDLYAAIQAALKAGHSAEAIREAANNERGVFLYSLFKMGYGAARERV